jgi:hypothetical protein
MTGAGLGIASFIKHTNEGGGGKDWLRTWHKGGKGEITVWLHTRAPIVPSLTHSFMLEDEFEDKETGRMKPVLRYPRFVSPDAEIVARNQYFRNDDSYKTMQVPPDRDPFLLLREWLRYADHIPLDAPVFQWNDEKNRKVVIWERGELSLLVKRQKNNFNHSLDVKLEYVYVVVDNENIDSGPVLMREGKLLSQKIVEVIKQQQKMHGEEEGDPVQHPYAFLLTAEDASSPMNVYKAFKNEKAAFSDAVWEAISGDDFPDPLPYGQPAEGDPEKIRDAFERAMKVDLPLDEIFSEDPEVRRQLLKPTGMNRPPARASKASQVKAAQNPPPPDARPKPTNGAATNAGKPAAATSASKPAAATGGPQMRRRRVEPPPPPEPEPAAERIPCDAEGCGFQMLLTDTKCERCGAKYEVVPDAAAPAHEQAPPPKPSTSAKPKPSSTVASATSQKPTGAASASTPKPAAADLNCWSCGSELNGATTCPACQVDQGDDIPF